MSYDMLEACDGSCISEQHWCPECDRQTRCIRISQFCVECCECHEPIEKPLRAAGGGE